MTKLSSKKPRRTFTDEFKNLILYWDLRTRKYRDVELYDSFQYRWFE